MRGVRFRTAKSLLWTIVRPIARPCFPTLARCFGAARHPVERISKVQATVQPYLKVESLELVWPSHVEGCLFHTLVSQGSDSSVKAEWPGAQGPVRLRQGGRRIDVDPARGGCPAEDGAAGGEEPGIREP